MTAKEPKFMQELHKIRERLSKRHRAMPKVQLLRELKNVAPEDKALKAIRDAAKRTRLDKLTIREIDNEIASIRREKRQKLIFRRLD